MLGNLYEYFTNSSKLDMLKNKNECRCEKVEWKFSHKESKVC